MSIGPLEIVVLAILAVVLFGPEKLPEFARKAARVLRYVRTIADDATGQLRRELGPEYADLELRDLHPRAFVRKHLLDDVEPIVADVKRDIDRVGRLDVTKPDGVRKALESAGPDASEPEQPDPQGQAESGMPEGSETEPNGAVEQLNGAAKPTIGEAMFSPAPRSDMTPRSDMDLAGPEPAGQPGAAGTATAVDAAAPQASQPPWDREAT